MRHTREPPDAPDDADDAWEEPTAEERAAWRVLMDVPKGIWGRQARRAVAVRPACLN